VETDNNGPLQNQNVWNPTTPLQTALLVCFVAALLPRPTTRSGADTTRQGGLAALAGLRTSRASVVADSA